MIKYLDEILKKLKKGLLPKEIFIHLNNAFIALDLTKDLDLFDIKQLKHRKIKKEFIIEYVKGNIVQFFI